MTKETVSFKHRRTGRVVRLSADDPAVKRLEAGKRWNRVTEADTRRPAATKPRTEAA